MASCIVEPGVSGLLDVRRVVSGGGGESVCWRNVWGSEAACVVRAIICSIGKIRGGCSGKTAFRSVFVGCKYAVVILPLWEAFVSLNFAVFCTVMLVGVLIAV